MFNLNFIYLTRYIDVCFKVNFLLQDNKVLSYLIFLFYPSLSCLISLIHCGNNIVCHKKTYYFLKHCTNNTCPRSSKVTILSHKLLPPIHSQTFARPLQEFMSVGQCVLSYCHLTGSGDSRGDREGSRT